MPSTVKGPLFDIYGDAKTKKMNSAGQLSFLSDSMPLKSYKVCDVMVFATALNRALHGLL